MARYRSTTSRRQSLFWGIHSKLKSKLSHISYRGKLMNIRRFLRKRWKEAGVVGVCAIVTLVFTVWAFVLQYPAPQRADLRLVLDPYEAVWTHASTEANFSVNGSLYNSGSTAAKILNYSLSVVYVLPGGDRHIFTEEFTNISRRWNVTN